MAYATYEDVVARWTGDTELATTQAQIETLLEDAEDTILIEFPTIQDRIDSGELREGTVVKVEAGMVIRHLRNPEGVRSAQMGAGPFQQSLTYGGDEPGSLYLTEADKRQLRGRASTNKAFSIDGIPSYYSDTHLDYRWWNS